MDKIDFDQISVHEGPAKSLGFLLWHVSTAWRARIEAALKPLMLTHPQFVILATTGWLTKDGEAITQAAIGKMAGLDPNTTSQILKGLEQRGLVKRALAADARAKQVSLSMTGAVLLKKALPAVEKADAAFFNALSKDENHALLASFQKLISFR